MKNYYADEDRDLNDRKRIEYEDAYEYYGKKHVVKMSKYDYDKLPEDYIQRD